MGWEGQLAGEDKNRLLSCRISTQIASELGAFGIPPADVMDMMAGLKPKP